MRRPHTFLAAVLATSAMLSGCALAVRSPSVQELKYNPGRYHNRTVAIDGVVTSSWGTRFLPMNVYKVDDGTGEVTIVGREGRVPPRGSHVRVKGKVNEIASFGGANVGLHLQETDLDFRR